MPRDNRLRPEEVERFFRIWLSVLAWTNQQKNVVPGARAPYAIPDAARIRAALWADDSMRRGWIDAHQDQVPEQDLALVQSWDHRVPGSFIVLKHYASHSVFLSEGGKAYAVLGLTDPLVDKVPVVPTLLYAVLLPFEDRITYDGLIGKANLTYGPGARRSLSLGYQRIQERGEVLRSLPPGTEPVPVDASKARKKANTSIIKAYTRHLAADGHSDAVRARDVAVVGWLADIIPQDVNLATLRRVDVEGALGSEKPALLSRTQVITALKRFTVFLGQSGRMDWREADGLHAWLRMEGRRR